MPSVSSSVSSAPSGSWLSFAPLSASISAPLVVTPNSFDWPVSTSEGATITAVPGDAVDMDVNRDASVGVILEVLAADPIDRVSDVDDAGGEPDILTKALGNEGDDVIAHGANQDDDALGIDVVGMLCEI